MIFSSVVELGALRLVIFCMKNKIEAFYWSFFPHKLVEFKSGKWLGKNGVPGKIDGLFVRSQSTNWQDYPR